MVIDYKPHSRQEEIHNDPSRFRVLVCGRKFGKTTMAVIECIFTALSRDNAVVWYLAPTYKQAKMIAWQMLVQFLPPELIRRKNEVELTIQLKRRMGQDSNPRYDSFISLKGTEDEDSLRGIPNIHLAVLDEYAYMKSHIWPMIIEPALRITEGRALFTGTPAGFNHFYDSYLLGQPGPKRDRYWKSWKLPTWENPYFPRAEMRRIQKFYQQADGSFADVYYQEYEADFRRFSGLIYKEFDSTTHIVQPFEIPKSWKRMPAFDPGYIDPFCVLWGAVNPNDGVVYIYREYYHTQKRLMDVISDITALSKGEVLEAGPCDPSRPDTINELNNFDISCYKGNTNITLGIGRVAQYLTRGKLKIFANCEKTIWEIERYEWKQPKGGMPGLDLKEEPVDKNNHAMDVLRYMMMEQPDLLLGEDTDDAMISEFERKHSNLIIEGGYGESNDPIFGDLDV